MQISVIIPIYKAEKYLRKAVESALQFDVVKEVLLIEDCSPDNSLDIGHSLSLEDSRVIVLQHEDKKNHGAGATRNLGLKNATCDFIAFLDADDYFLPNRFDAEKIIFKNNDDIDGVFGAIATEYYSESAKGLIEDLTTIKKACKPEEVFRGLIGIPKDFGYFSIDALTIRKRALGKMDYLFNSSLRLHQDSDFLVRLSYYTKLQPGEIIKPVAVRGVHDHNRITTAYVNHELLYKSKLLYYSALYNWSRIKNVGDEEIRHLKRMYTTARINSSKSWRWLLFFKSIILDKELLRNEYYYYLYHLSLFKHKGRRELFSKIRHCLFGKE
jgi:glycosyltransferase involved in cell wall biosynthesis